MPPRVEVLHHVAISRYVDTTNAVLTTDVGNALHRELIEGVERKTFYFQFLTTLFYLVDCTLQSFLSLCFCLIWILVGTVAVVDYQTFAQILTQGRCKACEPIEIRIVVLRDNLVNQAVFGFRDSSLRTFQISSTKFSRTCLLYIESSRLIRKGSLVMAYVFCIADILATNILAKPLIRVTCIDHHNVCVLFPELANDAIHMKGFATT